jgi:hypothetical protein
LRVHAARRLDVRSLRRSASVVPAQLLSVTVRRRRWSQLAHQLFINTTTVSDGASPITGSWIGPPGPHRCVPVDHSTLQRSSSASTSALPGPRRPHRLMLWHCTRYWLVTGPVEMSQSPEPTHTPPGGTEPDEMLYRLIVVPDGVESPGSLLVQLQHGHDIDDN